MALLLTAKGLFAQTTFTVGGINYSITSDSTVAVTTGGTYSGNITIPSTVPYSGVTYDVTSIGSKTLFLNSVPTAGSSSRFVNSGVRNNSTLNLRSVTQI